MGGGGGGGGDFELVKFIAGNGAKMTGMDVTALKQNALARVADFNTTVPEADPPAPSGCPLQPAHGQQQGHHLWALAGL